MKDVIVTVDSNPRLSSSDQDRNTELWNSNNEQFFHNIMAELDIKVTNHAIAGRKFKKINNYIHIPLIAFPIILSTLTDMLIPYKFVYTVILVSLGLLNGLNAYVNFSQKSERNLNFELKFAEIIDEINFELSHKKKFRRPLGIFQEKIKQMIRFSDRSAPVL